MAMASKELSHAVSAPSRASSLRSAKQNPSSAKLCTMENRENLSNLSDPECSPVEKRPGKRAKLSFEGQPNVDESMQVKTEEESAEVQKPRKKRKPFKGFVKKKRAPKKSKPHPAFDAVVVISLDAQNNAVAANSVDVATNLMDDQAHTDCSGERLEALDGRLAKEERLTTSIQTLESPKKARINTLCSQTLESPKKARINTPKLQTFTTAASPKKSSRHQHFNPSDTGHILAVKAALHLSTIPETLLCREAEQSKVFEFCKDHLLQQRPGSLYICGCPGTGKSILMEKVKLLASKWAEEGEVVAPEIFSFNCTSLTNPSDIFDRILRHISLHQVKKETKSCMGAGLTKLKLALQKSGDGTAKRMLLLIIDEIDYLLSKDRAILHDLFELPAQTKSRCILIGISNSIDLADRCLQNFSSLSCRPVVIPFSPYAKDQLIAVLNQRLKVLPFSVFQPAALELCARRVAAASGDMRKALHVCRIAIELLELERKTGADEKPAQNGTHISKPEAPSTPSKKICSPGQNKQEQHLVQIHHMAQALAKTFRSAAVDTVKSLPKHQQMVLCAAVRLFRQKKKDATLGQLNIKYVDFCKATGMPALSVPEFSSVCRVLADQGLLNLGTSREERLKRVTLQVDEDDIVFALQAIRFFCNSLT